MKSAIIVLAGCLAFIAAGCESGESFNLTVWEQNKRLRQEKTDLKRQLEELQAEHRQLQEQIKVLSELPAETKFEELYDLRKVVIARRSGLYDKDKDSRKEKLIVYVRPVDNEGDALKAAGAVAVELWDLNRKPEKALLGKWHIGPAELKKLWAGTPLTGYYRLIFDVGDEIAKAKELTVKVNFTNYTTGKLLTAQRTIKP